MQCASAYLFDGKLVIAPECQTTIGVWIAGNPVELTSLDPAEAGRAVIRALSKSKQGVPHPKDWNAIRGPLLSAANASSNTAFMRSAKHVAIEFCDGTLTLTPSRNLGAKNGFEPIEAASVKAEADATSLGQTLAGALSRAT